MRDAGEWFWAWAWAWAWAWRLGSLNGYESGLAASIGTNAALIATGDGVGWWLVSWLPGHSARGGVPSLLDTGSAGKGLRKMERIEHFDASSRSILSKKLNPLEAESDGGTLL